MPVPEALLGQLGELDDPAARVRRAVNELLDAAHEPESLLTVSEGVDALERAVIGWLELTEQIEQQLRGYAAEFEEDRFDAEARLGGIALLHLSIASDVATVAPFDDLLTGSYAAALQERSRLPEYTIASSEVLIAGGLGETLSQPIEPEGGDGAAPDPISGDRFDELIDDVVREIVDRAGSAGTSVLVGMGGVLLHVLSPMHEAVRATPAFIRDAFQRGARRIAKLVKRLVGRATDVLDSVFSGYRNAVSEVLEEAVGRRFDPFGAALIAGIVKDEDVRARAARQLRSAEHPRRAARRVGKTATLHKHWVGPVPWVAKGLPALWAVPIGPVPAGAVAAVVLLAWTILLTGDQLDSDGQLFPDLWAGVVRRAGGE
jgi:hypothetical protein